MDYHAEVVFDGKTTKFLLSDPNDEVQHDAARGTFYEMEQLIVHRGLIPKEGMAVIDVGACIGNHALFYSAHTGAETVFCFEPNPAARDLLTRNVELNSDTRINLDYAEYGCANKTKQFALAPMSGNLGGTKLLEVAAGRDHDLAIVSSVSLDNVLLNEPISFIKIDVEGMELSVLEGASKIIERYRPSVAVEVANENIEEFWRWSADNSYCVVQAFRMYWSAMNYVCVSKVSPTDTLEIQQKHRTYWEQENLRRKFVSKAVY